MRCVRTHAATTLECDSVPLMSQIIFHSAKCLCFVRLSAQPICSHFTFLFGGFATQPHIPLRLYNAYFAQRFGAYFYWGKGSMVCLKQIIRFLLGKCVVESRKMPTKEHILSLTLSLTLISAFVGQRRRFSDMKISFRLMIRQNNLMVIMALRNSQRILSILFTSNSTIFLRTG